LCLSLGSPFLFDVTYVLFELRLLLVELVAEVVVLILPVGYLLPKLLNECVPVANHQVLLLALDIRRL
jgi:hypothetical protein